MRRTALPFHSIAALLDHFGSVAALKKATLAELAATPGIGEKTAHIIYDYLATSTSSAIDMETGEIS